MKLAIVLLAMAISIYFGVVGIHSVADGHTGWGVFYLMTAGLWANVVFRQKGRA